MTIIYLDVETLPTNDQEVIDEFAASITPPMQYKKPDSIAAWLEENKAAAIAEKVAKTSFDGLYGRIACIAWAVDDGEIQSTLATDSEEEAISKFYDAVMEQAKSKHYNGEASGNITFCGHNIAGFDLPFMKHRSIIHDIKPPAKLLEAMNARPWDKIVADTMLMWSTDRENRVSMDKLCRAFGIAGKGDFDGSMVAETWPVDPQKVITYCKDDVFRARQIYKRLTWEKI